MDILLYVLIKKSFKVSYYLNQLIDINNLPFNWNLDEYSNNYLYDLNLSNCEINWYFFLLFSLDYFPKRGDNPKIFKCTNDNDNDIKYYCILLDLSYNLIKSLNKSDYYYDLRYLNLSNNYLSSIDNIECCYNLIELNISNNQIIDVTCLNSLTFLLEVDLSFNKVENIPFSFYGLSVYLIYIIESKFIT